MPRRFFPASAGRASTSASHRRAVERVILAMRAQMYEHLPLQSLAEIAILSPFHFDRIFRQITGIPPCQFLGALRLEAAKRLLLTTQMSVTDICFEVGYNSLGTFITRFTQLVGLPPRRLRHLADDAPDMGMRTYWRHKKSSPDEPGITGRVESPDGFSGPVLVGLFPTPIPQGRPVACAVLSGPGPYQIDDIPDGAYYAFAASFKSSEDPLDYLLPDDANVRVGVSLNQLVVKDGKADGNPNIELRSLELTDPPLLTALPFLLSEHSGLSSRLNGARGKAGEQMVDGADDEVVEIAKAG
jgi:AraC family transcriptional regulator